MYGWRYYAWFYWTIMRGLVRSRAAAWDLAGSCEGMQDLARECEISRDCKGTGGHYIVYDSLKRDRRVTTI